MAEPARPASGHYFDQRPSARSAPGEVRLDLPDVSLTLATDRGVFSPDRIDTGTKHLLLDGPAPAARGTLVDLGSGYGPIACALAARSPGATVWAVEVNERALGLCQANAARLGLANLHAVTPDGVPTDLVVDELWSNPPVRIGKAALHGLLQTWLGRLAPSGRALLVVQKHLGADSLHRWIDEVGYQVDRLQSRAGYRILEVHRA
ncbi:MAG: class I SAM-dependent methyltransferase [Acidimicrobiales bacterium]